MNATYRNAIAAHGASLITHVGLVNGSGTELSGGGYARLPASWTTEMDGQIRLSSNRLFTVPAGSTVAGWRGFSALTGGTDYDGGALTPETYANAGTYELTAAQTGINHDAA
jgi:hypothetical protein